MSTSTVSEPRLDGDVVLFLAGWGLVVWFLVAVTIRLAGPFLLEPGNDPLFMAFFVAVVPLMALVTFPVYRWLAIPSPLRGSAAAAMSVPGLFLDVLLVHYAETVFPAMSTDAVVNFAVVLLFGYAVVLVTGFVPAGFSDTTER